MNKYFANKGFYRNVGNVMIPIAIQSFINSLSGLIDIIMASRFHAVSAVSTALQIDALVQGIAFGIAAGINIFVVQYYGAKDFKNMKKSFGLSMTAVSFNALFWLGLSLGMNTNLLKLFIDNESVVAMAYDYLKFSCFAFICSSVTMSFNFAYHSVQKAYIPLIISIFVVASHVALNYFLMIFLNLGVRGAGISMLLTQVLNVSSYAIYSFATHQPFVGPLPEMFSFDLTFVKKVFKRVTPLVINETFFGLGNSLFIVAYGSLGKVVMDSYYIGNQIVNVFFTVVNAMSDAATSMIGYELGKHNYEEAENEVNYFLGIAFILAVAVIGTIMMFAPNIVQLFHVESEKAFNLSVDIIRVLSVKIAFRLFNVIVFASLRAGGDSKYLTLLDSSILWGVGLSLTYFMIYLLGVKDIVLVILLGQSEQLVRLFLGIKRVKSKKWIRKLV
ncbi:MATE family efflux transporter [Lacrimispora saccharolytica]|uniref:Probable multidrug resistance protein NorM n=1 Tax=Lacrimispora saccharolytica (strain ATCC 35040 / DSM 2544 / NRCC 2533 / WM1) TaxID=610130 RepID=D9R2Q5_LACSW|nr:MATE family efflux transporter [Lacrimispora saccharolytica]ADL06679.1 multi antimicrobial extrusion protein MatE [[Clostridium] saccharolyticum WM1]QRV19252.1 hypothetical protein I6K70_17585 [Lacrimispora saccharolytica]